MSAPLVVYTAAPDARAAFSLPEAAQLLGISLSSVRKAIDAGQLTAIRINDRTTRIPAWSIEALLAPERAVTVVAEGQVA